MMMSKSSKKKSNVTESQFTQKIHDNSSMGGSKTKSVRLEERQTSIRKEI